MSDAFAIQMITSSINVVSTIPGLYAIDRWGRRPLLFWGAVGMCISQFLVAMLGTLTTGQDASGNAIVYSVPAQKAGIAFVCIYIFFFASTWGPLAWVVTGEIFPLKQRARGLSITTATNVSPPPLFSPLLSCSPHIDRLKVAVQLGNCIRDPLPRQLRPRLREPAVQDLLRVVRLLLHLHRLCVLYIYETKGLTLEQVDDLYNEVSSARKSPQWTPTVSFKQRGGTAADQSPAGPGGVDPEKSELDRHPSTDPVAASGQRERSADESV